KYEAGENGSVTAGEGGSTEELHTVKTFERAEDGTITNVQDSPAIPLANVEATAEDGYRFVNWTSGDAAYANVDAIRELQLMEDTTFTANFAARDDLHYEVHYYYDGVEDTTKAVDSV